MNPTSTVYSAYQVTAKRGIYQGKVTIFMIFSFPTPMKLSPFEWDTSKIGPQIAHVKLRRLEIIRIWGNFAKGNFEFFNGGSINVIEVAVSFSPLSY